MASWQHFTMLKYLIQSILVLLRLTMTIRKVQHGRDLETWHLEAGRHLGTSEADTEVGVL